MPAHRSLRRSYNDNGDLDDLREQLDDVLGGLRGDVDQLSEQLTSLDVFTEELDRRQHVMASRLDRLDNHNGKGLEPAKVIRQLPPPLATSSSRIKRLAQLALVYSIITLNTHFAGAAIFSLIVGLVQVSAFYLGVSAILAVGAIIVGWRRLFLLPPF